MRSGRWAMARWDRRQNRKENDGREDRCRALLLYGVWPKIQNPQRVTRPTRRARQAPANHERGCGFPPLLPFLHPDWLTHGREPCWRAFTVAPHQPLIPAVLLILLCILLLTTAFGLAFRQILPVKLIFIGVKPLHSEAARECRIGETWHRQACPAIGSFSYLTPFCTYRF